MAHWAIEAYFKYGGEPHFIFPTTLGPSNLPLNGPAGALGSPFIPVSAMPLSMGGALGRPVVGPEVQLSGKYEGLSLYLSRLLRMLWNHPICVEVRNYGSPPSVSSEKEREREREREMLKYLKNWLLFLSLED